MTRTLRSLLAAFGLASAGAFAAGQPPAGPPPATGPQLGQEDLAKALKTDALSIPTPGELLAAIDKLGKPDWASAIRAPLASAFSSRAQMALNLGGLIADGYIAVEAKDSQQVKNIGRDIMNLAKPLGVQQDILNRGKSLTDFADHGQWDTLKEELEATQNEVKSAMAENKDEDLISLVTLGGWIRGIDAMADYVNEHYSPDGAKMLRQPAIARFLIEHVNALPVRVQGDPAVKRVRLGLAGIEPAVSFPSGVTPSPEAVKVLAAQTGDLLKDLARKQ